MTCRATAFSRAIALTLLLAGAPVHAQAFKVKGSVGAGVAWESNPFHLPSREGRRGDVRASPTLKIEVERDIGSYGVTLAGDVRYDRYARERELDAFNMHFDGRGHVRFAGRCRARAGVAFDTRRSDPADVGTATARSRSWDASVSAGCPRPAGLYPQLTARVIERSHSDRVGGAPFEADDIVAIYDSRTTTAVAEMLYSRPSLGTAAVALGYGQVTRPEASALPSIDLYRGGLRFERYIAPRLGGGLAIGYVHLRPETRHAFGMAEWRADVRWLLAPDRSVTASFSREARAESNVAAIITRTTTADLGLSFRLGGRSRLSAQAGREWRDFRGAVPILNRPVRDNDRTTRLAVQLEYRLTPTLLLDAHVTQAARDATPSSYRYRSTGTGLRLRYTF